MNTNRKIKLFEYEGREVKIIECEVNSRAVMDFPFHLFFDKLKTEEKEINLDDLREELALQTDKLAKLVTNGRQSVVRLIAGWLLVFVSDFFFDDFSYVQISTPKPRRCFKCARMLANN